MEQLTRLRYFLEDMAIMANCIAGHHECPW